MYEAVYISEERDGRRARELNRRLKLDLLITAGNAMAVASGSDSASYLIKPSFRNSHAAICHRHN